MRIARQLKALVGERHPDTSPRALKKTAHHLTAQFAKLGWATSSQSFDALGGIYQNVVAIKPQGQSRRGIATPPLVIGAHYDTVSGSPGADDNASGLVVLLEVAYRLRHAALGRPIWLVAFCLEEQDRLGSQAFAARLRADGQAVAGAIILECVGFATNKPNSQQTPPGVPFAVPTTGDFLAIVGNEASRSLVAAFEPRVQGRKAKPATVSLVVPGCGETLPHTRRSDHASFWDQGYPAVMVTDTANFRNPHYHRESDTMATVNLDFLAAVAARVSQAVLHLSAQPV
jgi:Zn-dependent M28 family amino/carboxypeptidase